MTTDETESQNFLQLIIDRLTGIAPSEPEKPLPPAPEPEPLRERTHEEAEAELAFLCEYLLAERDTWISYTEKWTSNSGKAAPLRHLRCEASNQHRLPLDQGRARMHQAHDGGGCGPLQPPGADHVPDVPGAARVPSQA